MTDKIRLGTNSCETMFHDRRYWTESALGGKLERQHIDARSLAMAAEVADALGIAKRSKQSSRLRSSHSIYAGPATNEHKNRTKKANILKRLFFFFFIFCLTKPGQLFDLKSLC